MSAIMPKIYPGKPTWQAELRGWLPVIVGLAAVSYTHLTLPAI